MIMREPLSVDNPASSPARVSVRSSEQLVALTELHPRRMAAWRPALPPRGIYAGRVAPLGGFQGAPFTCLSSPKHDAGVLVAPFGSSALEWELIRRPIVGRRKCQAQERGDDEQNGRCLGSR